MSKCIVYNGVQYTMDEFANFLLRGGLEKFAVERRVQEDMSNFGAQIKANINRIKAIYARKVSIEESRFNSIMSSSEDIIKLRDFIRTKTATELKKITNDEFINLAGLSANADVTALKSTIATANKNLKETKAYLKQREAMDLKIAAGEPVVVSSLGSLKEALRALFNLKGTYTTKDGKTISRDEAAATLMDTVFKTMAKRESKLTGRAVSVEDIYKKTFLKKSTIEELLNPIKEVLKVQDGTATPDILFQGISRKGMNNLGIDSVMVAKEVNKLMEQGKTDDEIFQATKKQFGYGAYLGPDGRVYMDMPDYQMGFALFSDDASAMAQQVEYFKTARPISEMIDYPELFRAYPQLKYISVKIDEKEFKNNLERGTIIHNYAVVNFQGKNIKVPIIVLNSKDMNGKTISNPHEVMSDFLHELQHIIQTFEIGEGAQNVMATTDAFRTNIDIEVEDFGDIKSLLLDAALQKISINELAKIKPQLYATLPKDGIIFSNVDLNTPLNVDRYNTILDYVQTLNDALINENITPDMAQQRAKMYFEMYQNQFTEMQANNTARRIELTQEEQDNISPRSQMDYTNASVSQPDAVFKILKKLNPETSDILFEEPVAAKIERLTQFLESLSNYYRYNRSEARYNIFRNAGLVWHGGSEIITNFDESKIQGGVRGELGYGYYFSDRSKASDYGEKITFLNASNLTLIDGNKVASKENLLGQLERYSESKSYIKNEIKRLENQLDKVKNLRDFKELEGYIEEYQKELKALDSNAVDYAGDLVRYINKYPTTEIYQLGVIGNNAQNKLFSKIMKELGYDGIQVSDNWQLVLFPDDSLNSLIANNPNRFTAEAYYKALADGSNESLVKQIQGLTGFNSLETSMSPTVAVEYSSVKEVTDELSKTIPTEVLNNIKVVEDVPDNLTVSDRIFLSMKKYLEKQGVDITSPTLMGWLGKFRSFIDFNKIKTDEQLEKDIEAYYRGLVKKINELKVPNEEFRKRFDDWMEILKDKPAPFKHSFLYHVYEEYRRNSARRQPTMSPINLKALSITEETIQKNPSLLNSVLKQYKDAVININIFNGPHEKASGGKGYWAIIPKTTINQDRYTLKALPDSYKGDSEAIKTVLNILSKKSIDTPEELLQYAEAIYNSNRLSTERNYYISNLFWSPEGIPRNNSDSLSLEELKEKAANYAPSYEEYVKEFTVSIEGLDEEAYAGLKKAITDFDFNLTNEYEQNFHRLKDLSPNSWCTASTQTDYYLKNYTNAILYVNGQPVAGIEGTDEIDPNTGKKIVQAVTNRANEGVASIEHLQETLRFLRKHGYNDFDRKGSLAQAKKYAAQNLTREQLRELELSDEEIEAEERERAQRVTTLDEALEMIQLDARLYEVLPDRFRTNLEVANLAFDLDVSIWDMLEKSVFEDAGLFKKIIKYYPEAFTYIPDSLKRDVDIALEAFKSDKAGYLLVDGFLLNDKNFIIKAAQINERALEYVNEDFKKDLDVATEVLKTNGDALEYFDDSIKNNRKMVLLAIEANPESLKFASKQLRTNGGIITAAIAKDGTALKYASGLLRNNKELVLLAIRNQGDENVLQFASPELQDDKEVVLEAVRTEGFSLRSASDRLKKDEDVVLAAIKSAPDAIQEASSDLTENEAFITRVLNKGIDIYPAINYKLQKNKKVAIASLKTNVFNFERFSKDLQQDKEVALETIRRARNLTDSIRGLSTVLKNFSSNRDLALEAVSVNGSLLDSYNFSTEALKDDFDIVLAAVKNYGYALRNASDRLKDSEEIVLAAVSKDGEAFGYASERLQKNKKIVLAALKNLGSLSQTLTYIIEKFSNDEKIIASVIKEYPSVYLSLNSNLQNNPKLKEVYTKEKAKQDKELKKLFPDFYSSLTSANTIQGYYDSNTDDVIIVSKNTPLNEAVKVTLHELAHRGMLRVAKQLGSFNELYSVLKAAELQLLDKAPELLKRTGHKSLDELILDYGLDIKTPEGNAQLLMELAARWAETFETEAAQPSWWKQLLQSISSWIKQYLKVELNEQEVNNLVRGFVSVGSYTTPQDTGVLYQAPQTQIKPGVNELFDSNPELANQVYEALGFKTKTSENQITKNIKETLPFKVIGDYSNIEEGLTGRKVYEETIDNNVYKFEISNYSYENEDNTYQSFYDIDFTVNGSEDLVGSGFFNKAEKAKQIIQALLSQNFGNDTVRFNVEESAKGKQKLNLYKRLMSQLGYSPSNEMEYALFYENISSKLVSLTPQQKQQALQQYSQYLDTGKQDIEGFKEFISNPSNILYQDPLGSFQLIARYTPMSLSPDTNSLNRDEYERFIAEFKYLLDGRPKMNLLEYLDLTSYEDIKVKLYEANFNNKKGKFLIDQNEFVKNPSVPGFINLYKKYSNDYFEWAMNNMELFYALSNPGFNAKLNQGEQAAYQSSGTYATGRQGGSAVLEEGQDIIHALTNPNVSSPIHELAHKYEKYLTDTERQQVINAYNDSRALKTGEPSYQVNWDRNVSEYFARGFEKYLATEEAPTPSLIPIFEAFAAWLKSIYAGILAEDIDVELNDDMKRIYAEMLGAEFETEIKSEVAETKQPATPTPVQPKKTTPKPASKPKPKATKKASVKEKFKEISDTAKKEATATSDAEVKSIKQDMAALLDKDAFAKYIYQNFKQIAAELETNNLITIKGECE